MNSGPGAASHPAAQAPWQKMQALPLLGLRTGLEPLRVEFAAELAPVLADPLLHTFIGGDPLTEVELQALYQRQVVGRNADGSERWLNWLVRNVRAGAAVGTVQATVSMQPDGLTAEVAWVIGTRYQGQGFATEAARLLADWLRGQNVDIVIAHIHPEHHSSMAVARAIGLTPTQIDVDGETRWQG